MFLFYRLLLAHFITDFPFQTKEIFELKMKSIWGGVLHSLIFLFTSCLLAYPYLVNPFILFFLFGLTILHYLIDYAKLKSGLNNIWIFLADQAIHIFVISLVLFLPSAQIPRFLAPGIIGNFYNNTTLILALIQLIIGTYGGSFIIYYLKRDFVDERALYRRDIDGMIERLIIMLLFILNGPLFFLIPVVSAIRIIFYLLIIARLKELRGIIIRAEPSISYQRVKLKSNIIIDLAVSPLFAVIIGIIFKSF